MTDIFKVTVSCYVCGGDGIRPVYEGATNEQGEFIPPGNYPCPACENGQRIVGQVSIPQLDDILDKCNDIFEKVNE